MSIDRYPTQEAILNDIVDTTIFDHRIIVAGSRGWHDYATFSLHMKEQMQDVEGSYIFYSGMAKSGADKLILDFCEKENALAGKEQYLYAPFPADWDRLGKRAGFARNEEMAFRGTWLIAFFDGDSHGTKHMIKVAHEKGIRVTIIPIPKVGAPTEITLHTIQMAQWRLANAVGVKFIDTTAKSGVKAFAPDMKDVMAYKAGTMSEDEYTRIYRDRMFRSREEHPKHWEKLTQFPAMAFACYCPEGNFCHRHLFIEEVKAYLEKREVKVKLGGEINRALVDQILDNIEVTPASKESL